MSEKPEAWTAIDSFVWPHIAANLIREQHAEIERLKAERDEAVRAEREACAKVCEPQSAHDDPLTAWKIAAAIRARGEVPR